MGYFFSVSKYEASLGLSISEWLLVVSGLLLIIGIFGEYGKSPPLLPKRLRPTKTFAAALVMLAVTGEFFGDGGVFVFSTELQQIADAEVITVRKQLAEQGPRWVFVKGENRKYLLAKLRPFAGQTVTVVYCKRAQDDDEVTQLWMQLSIVLDQEAGWKWDHRAPDVNCGGHGLMIQISVNSPERTREAAEALDEALVRIGMPGVIRKVFTTSAADKFSLSADPEAVQILVMSHP